jgi:hypothetical protein
MKKIRSTTALFLGLIFLSTCCAWAQDEADEEILENVGAYGSVNWSEGMVRALGLGLPRPYAGDKARSDALARRAAVVDARRNLLEVLGRVRIDSRTTVENFIAESDIVRSEVGGMLVGSSVLEEERLPDGSWRVTAAVPLAGDLSRILLQAPPSTPVEQASQRVPTRLLSRLSRLESRVAALERKVAVLSRRPSAAAPESGDQSDISAEAPLEMEELPADTPLSIADTSESDVQAEETAPDFTSILVDARGLDFKPSLKPSLVHEGALLYPGDDVNYDIAVDKGLVRYVRTFGAADDAGLSGERPLVLKAESALGSDLTLNAQDAAILADMRSRPGNLLEQCRVVIIF